MEMAAIDVKAKDDATDYASSKFGGEQGKMADSLGMLTGQMADSNMRVAEALQALSEGMNRPKQIVRGPDGRAIGVQ